MTNLEVHVLGGGPAGAAHHRDRLPGEHALADLDEVLVVVGVDGHEAVGMLDLDHAAVARLDVASHDYAWGRSHDRRAPLGPDIQPAVPAHAAPAEGRAH